MGIYIKDMKAPASCCKCRFSRWSNYGQVYMCNVCEKPITKLSSEYESTKPDWCPLVEIPEPHEGHWILHESPDGGEQYECSRCGVLWEFNDGTPEDNEAYFCPKCGAKMKGADT